MKRRFIVNTAGVAGYLLAVFSWLWAAIILTTSTSLLESITRSRQTESYPEFMLPEITLPSPAITIILLIVTAVMIGISIYAIYKVPAESVKQTSRTTKKSAEAIATLIERSQSASAKKHRLLTSRLVLYLKLLLIVAPVMIVAGVIMFASKGMELAPSLALIISTGGSLLSLIFFVIQYSAAKLLKVPASQLL